MRTKTFTNYARMIGLNVHYFREIRKLTQEQLAGKAETSTTYISRLERGVANPTMEVLLRIAQGLEVTLAELADRSIYLERAGKLSWALNLTDSQEKIQQKPIALQRAIAVILEYVSR